MKGWRKSARPVDRAVQELEERIAQLERQRRRLENAAPTVPAASTNPAQSEKALNDKADGFMKRVLKPTAPSAPAPPERKELFDVVDTPLRDLETEPIAFGQRPAADLFGGPAENGAATETRGALTESQKDKLARYLGAGSIRTYKRTRSIQRRDRNRFLTWIGLAVAALWVIYVVIR